MAISRCIGNLSAYSSVLALMQCTFLFLCYCVISSMFILVYHSLLEKRSVFCFCLCLSHSFFLWKTLLQHFDMCLSQQHIVISQLRCLVASMFCRMVISLLDCFDALLLLCFASTSCRCFFIQFSTSFILSLLRFFLLCLRCFIASSFCCFVACLSAPHISNHSAK